MKEKVKKVLKNRIFIFILSGLLSSSISVYAVTYFPSDQVTYDNKTSNLKATQVQSAIDELYNICNTSGSGGSGNNIYFTYQGTDGDGSGIYKMSIDSGSLTKIEADGSPSEITPYTKAKNVYIY